MISLSLSWPVLGSNLTGDTMKRCLIVAGAHLSLNAFNSRRTRGACSACSALGSTCRTWRHIRFHFSRHWCSVRWKGILFNLQLFVSWIHSTHIESLGLDHLSHGRPELDATIFGAQQMQTRLVQIHQHNNLCVFPEINNVVNRLRGKRRASTSWHIHTTLLDLQTCIDGGFIGQTDWSWVVANGQQKSMRRRRRRWRRASGWQFGRSCKFRHECLAGENDGTTRKFLWNRNHV